MPDEIMAVMIMALIMGVPIVAILTSHQRKMAELIHSKHRESESQVGVSEKLDMMMHELHNLRNQVNEQSIQLDDMRNAKSASQSATNDVADRIREEA